MEDEPGRHRLTREELDRLLGLLALEDGPHAELSPVAIEDYIHGRAGAEEQARVEAAMASSGAFREEVLGLAAAAMRGEEFAALDPPTAPRRRDPHAAAGFERPRSWIRRRPAVLAFCGLVALALLWILSPLPPSLPREPKPLYAVSLDRRLSDEQFERPVQRSNDVAPAPAARDLRDAALLSFFRAVEWKDGEFTIHPVSPEPGGEIPYRLDLELHHGGETTPWPYRVLLPPGAKEPRTAILAFPDLLLYWVDSNTWTGRAGFGQRHGQSLFLVVAYRLGEEGYAASAPVRIPPP